MRKQKELLFLSIAVFILILVLGGTDCFARKGNVNTRKLDAYFAKAHRDWKVPGMAIAIVKDGKIVFAKGYGVREFSRPAKVDRKTVFAIASNTKAFTSAALGMLVDEGKISWDDKVRQHLLYFQLYDPYVTENITIRDLLCHRSGLGTFSGDLLWCETSYTTVEMIKRARYLKQKQGFRTGFGYSNLMYMAAGEIIPAVTGTPWKEFVTQRIFKPLNMANSSIGRTDLKKCDNTAVPHYVHENGKTVTVPYGNSDPIAGAGAINSNVHDLAQWLIFLLDNGKTGDKQLIGKECLNTIWTAHNTLAVDTTFYEYFPMVDFYSAGLGWSLQSYHGVKFIDHGGGLDGMVSNVVLVPKLKLGAVILTNSNNPLPSLLRYYIADAYLGVPPQDWCGDALKRVNKAKKRKQEHEAKEKANKKEIKKKTSPRFQVNLNDYTGTYKDQWYGETTVNLENGKLVLKFKPSPILTSHLTPLHYDTFKLKLEKFLFFIPKGTGTAQFIRNPKGEVVELKVNIPNHDFLFTELELKKQK